MQRFANIVISSIAGTRSGRELLWVSQILPNFLVLHSSGLKTRHGDRRKRLAVSLNRAVEFQGRRLSTKERRGSPPEESWAGRSGRLRPGTKLRLGLKKLVVDPAGKDMLEPTQFSRMASHQVGRLLTNPSPSNQRRKLSICSTWSRCSRSHVEIAVFQFNLQGLDYRRGNQKSSKIEYKGHSRQFGFNSLCVKYL